jgi:hypothetical protein
LFGLTHVGALSEYGQKFLSSKAWSDAELVKHVQERTQYADLALVILWNRYAPKLQGKRKYNFEWGREALPTLEAALTQDKYAEYQDSILICMHEVYKMCLRWDSSGRTPFGLAFHWAILSAKRRIYGRNPKKAKFNKGIQRLEESLASELRKEAVAKTDDLAKQLLEREAFEEVISCTLQMLAKEGVKRHKVYKLLFVLVGRIWVGETQEECADVLKRCTGRSRTQQTISNWEEDLFKRIEINPPVKQALSEYLNVKYA